ncbi:YaeQ family protein [Psychromonas hadalis]|uniref:YaeQ family protein n=1 Tax=Psychromonas hadalis TaxID=211669 RepID=UPI0003B55280|nr:YaeQ family protein [Psychromonas hadalis]
MALKPTIYKMTINRSDLNNDIYDNFNLTVAQHPSENLERMMARVLAFCLTSQQEFLAFTKGLSNVDDPDIWAKSLSDEFLLWVDMGEPAFERIKKASRLADAVSIYSFNTKSDVWWSQGKSDFEKLGNLSVYQFEFSQIQQLTKLVKRTMELSITLSGESSYIATELGECEVTLTVLQQPD